MDKNVICKEVPEKRMYNRRVWLNKNDSSFTSSIVCFHGEVQYDNGKQETAFIEITDCYHKIRLHIGYEDSYQDYANKIQRIIDELTTYKHYLEEEKINRSLREG